MVVCVLYPRFELLAALGDRAALLSEPAALAPEAGREQVVGEVSAPAEAYGVVPGMRLGEAMSRCPLLRLVPPDPEGVRSLWHTVLDRLEAIGAEVESDRAGAAFFMAGGLRGIHGGDLAGVLAAARRALGTGARLGAAPSRFAAHAAALQARPRRRGRGGAVRSRPALESPSCPAPWSSRRRPPPASWRRVRSRCCAAAWSCRPFPRCSSGSVSARSGRSPRCPRGRWPSASGTRGCSRSTWPGAGTPRSSPAGPPEPVSERLELPEAASGQQLERALELLVARVLARRERRGRSLRALAVSARFVAGGTWRTVVTLRHASADAARIRLALAPRLAELPAPAETLGLEVESFGPPAHDQGRLLDEAAAIRRGRLGEAVRQARQAAGGDAALRILDVDPDSRIPERRAVLAPFPDQPAP